MAAKQKTAFEYKAEAYALQGMLVREGKNLRQDHLMNLLTRMNELSRLAGMAEVAERAMAAFTFEARGIVNISEAELEAIIADNGEEG